MKKNSLYGLFFLLLVSAIKSQSPGDTIVIKAFKYGSASRDTLIQFPNSGLTYEKIILKYNMRCKNNLVSNQSLPNQGCGEWDYSCNTFIVDSSRLEKALNQHPSHIISNFTGTTFPYVTQPVFDYYNYSQTTLTLSSVLSESPYPVGNGSTGVPLFLRADQKSGRSQLLYTAAELTTAGLTAGNIDAVLLGVSSPGGGVNFFKVGIRHTSATTLNANAPTLSGFTNVFNRHYNFSIGPNRLQFHTPFVWDGTSNILIDFSFTNTVPSNPIVFNGVNGAAVKMIHANNNYALDLSALGHVNLGSAALSSISSELTVSFWAYGHAGQMPANTVLLHGYGSNTSQRHLNLHLPWGNGSVYFDCGYTNSGYDRIDKAATAAEQGGQWNHWTFTKNATTGTMNIYLNGALWHSGTSKTKTIAMLGLILGKDADLLNNYKGKINELSIWNKELSLSDIQAWQNKSIEATHPFYNNLVAYYKCNEGTGLNIADTKNTTTVTGVNLQWTYDRGQNITRTFAESTLRPNVTFLRGTYAMTTATTIAKDSLQRNPEIIQQYTITTNSAPTDDVVNLASTSSLYRATPSRIFDGETGAQTGTIAVTPTGTVVVNNLNYYKYYPFYNELLSFVTPYGKGLSMGIKGRTWYYDISDFAPLLKGKKRLLMTMGGEFQEQMDLDFIFIVGTPPRNVLEFRQLWQGAARLGGVPISQIINDSRFEPVSVALQPGGHDFKLRSTITGHGSHGEFQQNGGQVNHSFNINGGPAEYTWQISEACAYNPVYPQGGTWVYNRQGWCPGQTSLMKEQDLDAQLTAGTTVTLDYHTSNPPNPAGDYRYLVAHQLVTYGTPNHNIDAAIEDVMAPSDKVLYSRWNPACAGPVIVVRNTGSTTLTSIDFEYWVNNASQKQSHNWTGSLAYMDTAVVQLPLGTLWNFDIAASDNRFNVEIKKANDVTDDYQFNNKYSSPFVVPGWVTPYFSVEVKTNNNLDNTYTLLDENGVVVGSSNFISPVTVYEDFYDLAGCYKLIIEDAGHDGLSWWANTNQGVGYARIKNSSGAVIYTFQPDFGRKIEYSFTTHGPLAVKKNELEASLSLYPNPAKDKFFIKSQIVNGAEFSMRNVIGQTVNVRYETSDGLISMDVSKLTPGIYFVTLSKNGDQVTKKVVVN